MTDRTRNPLIEVYLQRRQELERYFSLRLRSPEAARDLMQDIYLKIPDPAPDDLGHPAAYLYRLGSNLMLDQIKQRMRAGRRDAAWRDVSTHAVGAQDVQDGTPADEALAARQRLSQIVAAVQTLPPTTREAFRLHKLMGLSHAETAAKLGISRSSVEKHIMASLKVILERVGR